MISWFFFLSFMVQCFIVSRITKYPLLIEPLIKTAKDRPDEQQKLRNCLHLVKSILIDVNGQVTQHFWIFILYLLTNFLSYRLQKKKEASVLLKYTTVLTQKASSPSTDENLRNLTSCWTTGSCCLRVWQPWLILP